MKFGDAQYLEQVDKAKRNVVGVSIDHFDLGTAIIAAHKEVLKLQRDKELLLRNWPDAVEDGALICKLTQECAEIREELKLSEARRAELVHALVHIRSDIQRAYDGHGMPEAIQYWYEHANKALAAMEKE